MSKSNEKEIIDEFSQEIINIVNKYIKKYYFGVSPLLNTHEANFILTALSLSIAICINNYYFSDERKDAIEYINDCLVDFTNESPELRIVK
jgi:hypothetical protein